MAAGARRSGLPDRVWRIFGTGFSFAVFGLAGIVCGLTVFPAACLTAPDPATARRRAQWIIHRWFGMFARMMRAFSLVTWEVRNAEALRQPGRLIVANHPSLIDVVLLIAHIPEVDCIVKPAIFANPFMRWPAQWAGYLCHDSAEQLVADCAATLKRGHSLLVFPEGTRTTPGQPIRMMHGAARIAVEADATILPVTIVSDPVTLTKGLPWYRVPPRTSHYRITAGEPYPAAQFLADAGSPSIAARRLTHHWERYFAAHTGAAPAHPLAPPAAQPQYSS